jgi:putative transposase
MIQGYEWQRRLRMTAKEKPVGRNLFWLDDLQWSVLRKHLPKNQKGAHRKDDRRIISGIIHVLQSGCRWQDCPKEYGPSTTVYNRFHRWAKKGLWQDIFNELTSIVGTHYENSIDSTIIKAHRSASGKKGVVRKPSAKAGVGVRQKSTPRRTKKAVR